MNEIDVNIDGKQSTWSLSASFQNGCSVMKDNSRYIINGVRILTAMQDYRVCVLISPDLDSTKTNSVDVFIEELYTDVPNDSWKDLVASALMEHLEKVFDYCQSLPNSDFISIINKNTVYN